MRRVTDLIIHLFSKIKVDKLKEGKSRAGACWVISVKGGAETGCPAMPNWAQLMFEVNVGWRYFIVAWAVSFDSSA